MRMLALIALVTACGTEPPSWQPDAGDCEAYIPPAGTNLMAPTTSFKTDVMPVISAHCSSSICHGISDGATGNLFLGAELQMGADAASVYPNLMAKSDELNTMPYVTPSDPGNSYLMHKVDADQCTLSCTGGSCMASMPLNSTLPLASRDIIRRWIAQGALNN